MVVAPHLPEGDNTSMAVVVGCYSSSRNVHSPEELSLVVPQLNYITDIVLELKVELTKIKTKVMELKNYLTKVHLSLINEVRHNAKSTSNTSTPFLQKYYFQNP